MAKQLSKEELKKVQDMTSAYNQGKVELADTMLKQDSIKEAMSQVKTAFAEYEKVLMKKYGANSVINICTGEVKTAEEVEKEKEKEKKE